MAYSFIVIGAPDRERADKHYFVILPTISVGSLAPAIYSRFKEHQDAPFALPYLNG